MPKSKHRKNHKKKLNDFKNKNKERQNKMRKAYMELMNSKKAEELEKQIQEQENNESDDIVNADDILD